MANAALFEQLTKKSPKVLNALKGKFNDPRSWTHGESPLSPTFEYGDILEELVGNRGYDLGLIEDRMDNLSAYDAFRNNPSGAAAMALSNVGRDLKPNTGFPSDVDSGMDLIGIAEGRILGEHPASIAAGNMIKNGIPSEYDIPPYPGGLSEVEKLSNEIDNLPNSPHKTALVKEMNQKAKPTKLTDLYHKLIDQPSYNRKKGNFLR